MGLGCREGSLVLLVDGLAGDRLIRIELRSDLLERQLVEVVHRQDLALAIREFPQDALHLRAVRLPLGLGV